MYYTIADELLWLCNWSSRWRNDIIKRLQEILPIDEALDVWGGPEAADPETGAAHSIARILVNKMNRSIYVPIFVVNFMEGSSGLHTLE